MVGGNGRYIYKQGRTQDFILGGGGRKSPPNKGLARSDVFRFDPTPPSATESK